MRMLYLLVTAIAWLGCTERNPNVCCTDQADCAAQGLPLGTTCGPDLVCRGNQCVSLSCNTSADCDSSAPYCSNQHCAEACTSDNECPGLGMPAGNRFCRSGICVPCSNEDCSSDVCDVESGSCVAESEIRYAASDGLSTTPCTKAMPCSFDKAISITDSAHAWVRMLPGVYATAVTIRGKSFILVGTGATYTSRLDVAENANIELRGLRFAPNPCQLEAIYCDPPTATTTMKLTGVEMTCAELYSSRCQVILTQSTFAGNVAFGPGAVARVDRVTASSFVIGLPDGTSAQVSVMNSVLRRVGFVLYGTAAANATFAYNTIYSDEPIDGGQQSVVFTNNVFYSASSSANTICSTGTCKSTFDTNISFPQNLDVGTNTIRVDPKLVDPFNGDFHLRAGSPAIDAAKLIANEPGFDLDGTLRPQGSKRDVGAFEYKP